MILTYSTFTWEKSKQTVRVLGFDRVTLGSWHIFNFRKPPRSMVRIRNTDTEGTVKEKRFVSSMWLLISICKLMNPWWLLILWKCLCYFLLWLLFFILFLCLFFVLFRFVFSSKRASRRAFLRPREDLKRVEERFLHFVLLKIKRNDLLMYD